MRVTGSGVDALQGRRGIVPTRVLTVGTINWSLGLSQDGEFTEIDQITLNIFTQLG